MHVFLFKKNKHNCPVSKQYCLSLTSAYKYAYSEHCAALPWYSIQRNQVRRSTTCRAHSSGRAYRHAHADTLRIFMFIRQVAALFRELPVQVATSLHLLKLCIFNELYVYVYFEIENEAPLVNKHTSILNMESRRRDFCKSGSAIPNMTFSTRNVDPLTIGVIHEEVCQLLVKTRPHYPPNSQVLLYKYCFFA